MAKIKPEAEKAIKVKKVIEPKPITETVKYAPVIEIDASKLKILKVNGGTEGDKMLLKCTGMDNLRFGKWIIVCEGLVHANFVFEKEWELISICRI